MPEGWTPPPPLTPEQEARWQHQREAVIAYVDERQKQQQADAIAEQRRQTSRLRTRHREEIRSLKHNEASMPATRQRQVQDRKAIFDKHRDERRDLTKAQEADYDRQLGERLRATGKAAEIEQEQARERGQGHELNR
jgi:hypothetical protein